MDWGPNHIAVVCPTSSGVSMNNVERENFAWKICPVEECNPS